MTMADKKRMSRVDKRKAGKKGKKKPKKSLFKRILLFFGLLIGLVFLAGAGLFVYYASSAPEITEEDLIGTLSSEVLDEDGNVFYEFGSENREFVTYDQIPQVLEDAVISIEDQHFYNHIGIDPIRIAGAVVA